MMIDCDICGTQDCVEPREETYTLVDPTINVPMKMLYCNACGSEFAGQKEMEYNIRMYKQHVNNLVKGKKFPYTVDGCEAAKEFLLQLDKLYIVEREDGYTKIAYANSLINGDVVESVYTQD